MASLWQIRTTLTLVMILIKIGQHAEADEERASSSWFQTFNVSANATGGMLVLGDTNSPLPSSMAMSTEAGESPESVAAKIADLLNSTEHPLGGAGDPGMIWAEASGNTLTTYALISFTAGTETGLGIPPPPLFLTADWDVEKHEIQLWWENTERYALIGVLLPVIGVECLNGDATACTLQTDDLFKEEDFDGFSDYFAEFGHLLCRLTTQAHNNCLPSGLAEVEIRPNSVAELYRSPFSGGVAPNWRKWRNTNLISPLFRQETRWDPNEPGSPRYVTKPEDAPYYQILEARGGAVDGGLYRKFLGLSPGQKYKLNMRLRAVIEGDGQEPVLTVNALCARSTSGSLSEHQLTGSIDDLTAPAGAHFRQEVPFQGKGDPKWLQLDSLNPEPNAHTVIMPQGCDTLHVWLRLQSNAAHATVGMDWVELAKID